MEDSHYLTLSYIITLISWLDGGNKTSWRALEENMIRPLKLIKLLFSNIPLKKSQSRFGPIVTHALAVWRAAEKMCDI